MYILCYNGKVENLYRRFIGVEFLFMLLIEENTKLNQEEFDLIIKDLVSNETVQKMKHYKQHYDTSCFEHCKNVAYYSYLICKKYHLDYISAARARNAS